MERITSYNIHRRTIQTREKLQLYDRLHYKATDPNPILWHVPLI